MRLRHLFCLLVLPLLAVRAYADIIPLGNADSFAVLAGSTVTNVPAAGTIVTGDLGVWPGTAVTGFPPGIVTGTIHAGDAVAQGAQTDLTTAYNTAAGLPCPGGNNLTGQDLGGLTLDAGVYCFASSAQLTGTLTLDAQGLSDAEFVFQIGKTLTTGSASKVVFVNSTNDEELYWQVGSSATLGTDTAFVGNILALTSITLNTRANISCGRALARNGAVTMDHNRVSIGTGGCESTTTPTPEPSAFLLLATGLIGGAAQMRRAKAWLTANRRARPKNA